MLVNTVLTPAEAIKILLLDRTDPATGEPVQEGLFDEGAPLDDVTFIIVDVETTGLGASARLTEIAAAKARGGKIIDIFTSLVNPHMPIPSKITALTGITSSMVMTAPDLSDVFPKFLEFANFDSDTVFVAHNASFDLGFIRRAAAELSIDLPPMQVVDTLALARLVLPRPLIARHNLSTLATYFSTSVRPSHRAGDDVSATTEVLYGLLSMIKPLGVTHMRDLAVVARPVPQRHKTKQRQIAHDIVTTPGVYHFLSEDNDVLYVGSATNLHSRVNSYFTAGENRKKIRAMLQIAANVRTFSYPDVLTSRIRELNDIVTLSPSYNVRTPTRSKLWFVRQNAKKPDRVQTSNTPGDDSRYLIGPFSSKRQALAVKSLINGSSIKPRDPADIQALLHGDGRPIVEGTLEKMQTCCVAERFEEANDHKKTLRSLLYGLRRGEALLPILRAPKIIFAFPLDDKRWRYMGISYGRLVITGISADRGSIDAVLQLLNDMWPAPDGSPELSRHLVDEALLIADYLYNADSRIIDYEGALPLAMPITSAHRYDKLWAQLNETEMVFR